MIAVEQHLLGEWRQAEPDPHPGAVIILFEPDGRLRYTVEDGTVQHILLTWRIDGDVLVTDQPSAPREERTRLRLVSPSRLVLEQRGESCTYERI
jgi:hypothetical protein